MLIKKPADIPYSEITPKDLYLNRRKFLAGVPAAFLGARELLSPSGQAIAGTKLPNWCRRARSAPARSRIPTRTSPPTTTSTNSAPARTNPREYAKNFKTSPVDRLGRRRRCAKPRKFDLDEILKLAPLEERIYRHRCVEALVDRGAVGRLFAERAAEAGGAHVEGQVTSRSRAITTPSRCRSADRPASSFLMWKGCAWTKPCIRWRCCASACTARRCRTQDGAPVRMVVPWKYGFKSIKSIVKIKLVEKQPPTTWNHGESARIRLLFERESGCGPSALEPGRGAPPGRVPQARQR